MKEIESKLEELEEAVQLNLQKTKLLEDRKVEIPNHGKELETIKLILSSLQKAQAENEVSLSVMMKRILTRQQKPSSYKREFRFLLFPETNQGHYYRIVFGKLIPWGMAFMVSLFLFAAGMKAIENWKYRVHDETLESRIKAWTYLREYGGKEVNLQMDRALGGLREKKKK